MIAASTTISEQGLAVWKALQRPGSDWEIITTNNVTLANEVSRIYAVYKGALAMGASFVMVFAHAGGGVLKGVVLIFQADLRGVTEIGSGLFNSARSAFNVFHVFSTVIVGALPVPGLNGMMYRSMTVFRTEEEVKRDEIATLDRQIGGKRAELQPYLNGAMTVRAATEAVARETAGLVSGLNPALGAALATLKAVADPRESEAYRQLEGALRTAETRLDEAARANGQLAERHAAERERLVQQHGEELAAARDPARNGTDTLTERHRIELEQNTQRHTREASALESQLQALTESKDAIQRELQAAQARIQELEQAAAQVEPRLTSELDAQKRSLTEEHERQLRELQEAHQLALAKAKTTGASEKATEMEVQIRQLQERHEQELALLKTVRELLSMDPQQLTKQSRATLLPEAQKLYDALVLSRELLKIAKTPTDELADGRFKVAKGGGSEPATLLTKIRGLLTDLAGQRQEVERLGRTAEREKTRAAQAEEQLAAMKQGRDEESRRADSAEAALAQAREQLARLQASAVDTNHVDENK